MPKDTTLERLYALAEGQDGYFSMPQALKAGIARNAVVKAAHRGRVERISQGVYRLGRFPVLSERTHLWESVLWPQARECVSAALSHQTALTIHGLSDANPAQVHITVPKSFRVRRDVPLWLTIHRASIGEAERDYVEGLPVTTVERTLRDIAVATPSLLHDAIEDAKRKGYVVPSDLTHD
ncbi:MAG: type IV toxin-antitoxin system AbiEi family antitoxin domain-containing protein [Candidatus Cybelea sp.]